MGLHLLCISEMSSAAIIAAWGGLGLASPCYGEMLCCCGLSSLVNTRDEAFPRVLGDHWIGYCVSCGHAISASCLTSAFPLGWFIHILEGLKCVPLDVGIPFGVVYTHNSFLVMGIAVLRQSASNWPTSLAWLL
jgi:hypothetical protein